MASMSKSKYSSIAIYMTGNIHVGETDEAVKAICEKRLRKGIPNRTKQAILNACVVSHHDNQRLYMQVMRGK